VADGYGEGFFRDGVRGDGGEAVRRQYCEQKACHSAREERVSGLGNGESVLGTGEVFVEVWK
jgi:hypothetical protein